MTQFLRKTTTALSMSLLLVQPGQVAAQAAQQACTENPTLPECVVVPPAPVPGVVPGVMPDGVLPEGVPPEAVPAPEDAPVIVPEPVPPPPALVPEPAPDLPVETPPAEAQEPAPAPPALVPEAAPELPVETPPAEAPEPVPAPPELVPEPAPDLPVETPPAEVPAPVPSPTEPVPQPAPDVTPEAPAVEAPAPPAPEATPETPPVPALEAVVPEATEPMAPDATGTAPAEPEAVAPADPAVTPEPVAPPAVAPDVTGAAPPEAEAVVPPAVVAEPLPAPTREQAQTLETLLADPVVAAAVETLAQTTTPPVDGAAGSAVPVAGAALTALGALATGGAVPDPAASVTRTLGEADARSSAQDFTSALSTAAPTRVEDDDDGLSDLEKAGLVALGAVVVGMLINRNRVVANSGDRVVVDRGNGDLAIWKDDDAILRAPGVVETTQRFDDGSTLTVLDRPDGSQIITVRDATGRVLRRDRVDVNGRRVPIIDDTRVYAPVQVSRLPAPLLRELRFTEASDPAMIRALLQEAEQPDIGRSFSLAQVRDIRQLRVLAPELAPEPIIFASGSSSVSPEQAGKLARLGALLREMIAENPSEVFLIEGHTDAVGGAAPNLALSDRRAESVALALSGIFGVPPENMVVQGYGESDLRVATPLDEPQNRRVALRRITWLVDDPV